MKTLAERLKFARSSKGWTQAHLAIAADVSTGTVGNIESGLRQSKGSLPQLAEALEIRHAWLSKGIEPMELPAPQIRTVAISPELVGIGVLLGALPDDRKSEAIEFVSTWLLNFLRQSAIPATTGPGPALNLETPSE
ncbi:MAG: helix-turn-helix transcriptional regulator [Comamonadaceae bacterium]